VSLRGLLVLVVLLIAVVSYVVWIDREAPGDEAKPELGALLPFEAKDVRRIEIDRSSGTLALDRRGEKGWLLAAPAGGIEADPSKVDELLRSLGDARTVAVVEEKGGHEARFGLAPAELAVRLVLDGKPEPRTLRLGRKSPVGFERYATAGDGRIVLADASLASALDRPAGDFEEKRLLPVAPEDVRRILIRREDGNLSLAKIGSDWRLLDPVRDAADASAADGLARALTSLAVTRRVDADEERRLAAERPAVDRAEVETGAGEIRRIEIRKGKGGEALAARADHSLVGTVPETSLRELSPAPDDLRDRRVAALPQKGIRSVSIETAGKKLRAWRNEDDGPWSVAEGSGAGAPGEASKVEGWIDRLRWARAEGFETGADVHAKHVVVLSGTKDEIGRLDIGDEAGGKVLVRSTFRPGIVLRVSSEAFSPVPVKPADLEPDPKKP
jgi:hypothetical protein